MRRYLIALLICGVLGAIRPAVAAESEQQFNERMEWFRDARFGMFIHWGLYSIPAGEWKGRSNHAEWIRDTAQIPLEEYNNFVNDFNPTNFNANAWVRLAKRAGMRYLVITSKHHDGFCLWDSKFTDFDVMSTPFKRDILKELRNACKRQDVRFCTYHSIMDWHHSDYLPRRKWETTRTSEGADFERYLTYLRGQLKELVRGYGTGILWFDGEWESTWTHELGAETYDYVRSLNRNILINNRVDKGRRGMQGLTQGGFKGDFGTPEQEIPSTGIPGVDWESCMTMNDHWGWNKADKNWKSTQDLIRKLIDCASKGGNFLLNVGPRPDGTFPEEAVERLEGIGKWMDVNYDSIYNTTASPFRKLPWGRCTQKRFWNSTRLYLHVFDWPATGQLLVPGLLNQTAQARLLANGQRLTVGYSPEGMTISVPEVAPDLVSSTVVLDFAGEPILKGQGAILQNSDGSIALPAEEALFFGEGIRFEDDAQRNCIGYWMNPADSAAWDVVLYQDGTFQIAVEHANPEPPRIELQAGGASMIISLPATGDYGKFQVTQGGTVSLPVGKASVAIRGVEQNWNPANIRSIRLSRP